MPTDPAPELERLREIEAQAEIVLDHIDGFHEPGCDCPEKLRVLCYGEEPADD